ncbi:MAG: GAF domain-containing protein [Desulfovibrionaceae bacterium]
MTELHAMSRDECLRRILGIVLNVFHAHTVALFLRSGSRFPLAGHMSLSGSVDPEATIRGAESLCGWILENAKPLLLNNFDSKRGQLGYYASNEEAHIKAFMGIPIGEGEGVLCLDSKRTYSFSTRDQKILAQFADLISSVWLEMRCLSRDLTRKSYFTGVKALQGLHQEHPRWPDYLRRVLDLLAESSGFSHAFLAVQEESPSWFVVEDANRPLVESGRKPSPRRFPVGQGLVGWIFREGSGLVLDGSDSRQSHTTLLGKDASTPAFKTAVCEPLFVNRKVTAVLGVASEEPGLVSPDLRDFLRMGAQHLSLFLENLSLKCRMASQAKAAKPTDGPGKQHRGP